MTLKRYHITIGARTTAGGVVKTASTKSKVNGLLLAIEGDLVDCPACHTQGVIQVVPPRLPDRSNGKEYALSDDLCICKCHPPPKLIASQQFKCQTLAVASAESAEETAARTVSAGMEDLLPMRFVDLATGTPYANRPFRLEMRDKSIVTGTTDADGCTRLLTRKERDALAAWHVAPTSGQDSV